MGHRKWFLDTNLFLIKPSLIAKFDCTTWQPPRSLFDAKPKMIFEICHWNLKGRCKLKIDISAFLAERACMAMPCLRWPFKVL